MDHEIQWVQVICVLYGCACILAFLRENVCACVVCVCVHNVCVRLHMWLPAYLWVHVPACLCVCDILYVCAHAHARARALLFTFCCVTMVRICPQLACMRETERAGETERASVCRPHVCFFLSVASSPSLLDTHQHTQSCAARKDT